MNVFEAISKRYSCRSYETKSIEQDKLNKILEAARLAPSARNRHDWRFVVVTDQDMRSRLYEATYNQKIVAQAPAVIVACSNNNDIMRCGQPVAQIDVAIALEHIALQAVEERLATCWIGSFYPEKVRAVLGIPDDIAIIELMTVGYPADIQPAMNREPIENIACFQKWEF